MKHYLATVDSVCDAVDLLKRLRAHDGLRGSAQARGVPGRFPFGVWFRGQENSNYSLQPRVFRPRPQLPREALQEDRWLDSPYLDETNYFVHSRLRLAGHQDTHQSRFDWLCLMQHYDLPTRLLDWSESLLVALYFSVRDCALNRALIPDDDGELIILDARRLGFLVKSSLSISNPESADVEVRSEMAYVRAAPRLRERVARFLERIRIESLASPVAVFPNRFNARMAFQSSVFTLHGGKLYHPTDPTPPEDRFAGPKTLEELNAQSDLLFYVLVPKGAKREIAEELFELGIHEGSLFPEIDKQAKYMERLW